MLFSYTAQKTSYENGGTVDILEEEGNWKNPNKAVVYKHHYMNSVISYYDI